jgi:hypothetical protein
MIPGREPRHISCRAGLGAGFLLGHLKLKAGLFDAPEAHHAPAGDGHILDTACFDGIGGLQFALEGGEERGEGGGGLVIENDGAGEDAMAAAVLGGPEFALGRFGSTRLGAVGAGGLDTTCRTHLNPIVVHDCFVEVELRW